VTEIDSATLDRAIRTLADRLLDRRAAPDHWDGHLASSALSTGTAILALDLARRHGALDGEGLRPFVDAGLAWLVKHQNADGGWGDTVRSRSNISTTAIVWAAISDVFAAQAPRVADRGSRAAGREAGVEGDSDSSARAIARAEVWLRAAAGEVTPEALRAAILRRYGKDQTFSVPILTVLALTGKLGPTASAWHSVPQLPFELAALPHHWFQHLRLPVVSYALPALIAIGQVRHHFAASRNPMARALRERVRDRTHRVLRDMQPESGGYLEATPLTSFVVMSLAGMQWTDSPVVHSGVRFLVSSMRDDGSWPIDTNLATWVTTLSIGALARAERLPEGDREAMQRWLLDQQTTREHPFTHAAPGAWAWTPLSGGVPDADDTSGALLALAATHTEQSTGTFNVDCPQGAARWLLGVQNRDGGVATFCRGWGTLPFDRSTPEITAHALRAWSAWYERFSGKLQSDVRRASVRALAYLARSQRADGSWIPLWFGNEKAPGEDNPAYGTARVLSGLHASLVRADRSAIECRHRAVDWLLRGQNADGGWGGDRGVASSIEETGVVVAALATSHADGDSAEVAASVARAARWLIDATANDPMIAAPVGLYFARLWYYEELYPLVFALDGLACVRRH
jgi:squalene-hopene/tetraprenyl-beta-curcumene cyclase